MSFTNIDVDAIKMDNKVVLKDGHGVLIKLVQGNTKPITFQTPLMSLAWNVQVRTQEKSSTCNLPLSFGTTNSNVMEFRKFLDRLRNKIKDLIKSNVIDWYGKDVTEAQIEEYLAQLIKLPPPNTAYSACFLPKIAHSAIEDGFNIDIKCFGIDKKAIDTKTALMQGSRVGAIINIPYIHIGKGNKQMSLRADVTQCLVLPVQNETAFGFDLSLDDDIKAVAEDFEKESKKRSIDDVSKTEKQDDVKTKQEETSVDYAEYDNTSHIEM